MPIHYDMLYLGDCCNFHIPKHRLIPNCNIYRENGTKCTDSYIVSNKCASAICQYTNNISYKIFDPIDHWLNVVIRDCKLNVYWCEPTIVTQGSGNGTYKSSISYIYKN